MKSPKGYLTWQDVFGKTFIGSGESPPPEPQGCVYPLDVKPELISLLGFEPFNVLDSCGHKLTSSGADSHAAISQAAAEALAGGGQIPEEHILPPSYLGEGIYAVEFYVDVTLLEERYGGVFLSIGGTLVNEIETYRLGSVEVRRAYLDAQTQATSVMARDENDINVERHFLDTSSVRVGLYYNTDTQKYGFIANGEDVGYIGPYSQGDTFILFAYQFIYNPSEVLPADVSIDVFTKGQDLTFTYPEGTVGLDGKPAGG